MSIIDKLFSSDTRKNNIKRFKEEFYLGKISRVYRDICYLETDNFLLLQSRINRGDFLIPNTINYLVVINSISGIYLAEVISSQLSGGKLSHDALMTNSDKELHPIIELKLIGIYQNDTSTFRLSGFNNVGIGDKVYVATSKIKELYESSLEIQSVKNNNVKKLCFAKIDGFGNQMPPFKISANGLLSNHFMIIGSTNSGKSTSALAILDQLHQQKVKFIIIDPTGEYGNSFNRKDNPKKIKI